MEIITEIKITSANLMQVFKLPCVAAMLKAKDDKFGDFDVAISLRPEMMTEDTQGEGWFKAAFIGDMLVEYENHKWRPWRTKHSVINGCLKRLMKESEPKQLELFPED